VIVLLEAPLGPYTLVPSEITALVSRDYVAAATIASVPAAAASEVVYDGEDAFFTPYGGIEAALQPGPTIRIYERRR
jgi:hypothetical protein